MDTSEEIAASKDTSKVDSSSVQIKDVVSGPNVGLSELRGTRGLVSLVIFETIDLHFGRMVILPLGIAVDIEYVL
ncbi:hypothetical protein Tco_0652150 [Tanacetum coccineum]|uniref:Uncharacterized protein n=1 Tax=Tanacetum coccineum TaxID=301880 RepID=A0ABQ4WWR6_9ASTR